MEVNELENISQKLTNIESCLLDFYYVFVKVVVEDFNIQLFFFFIPLYS